MQGTRSLAGLAALIAAIAAMVLAPAGARAAAKPDYGPLSQRLGELTFEEGPFGSRSQRSAALGLAPQGPGSLVERGTAILVEARFDEDALSRIGLVRDAGMAVMHASSRYETLTLAATPAELARLARMPGVEAVTEVIEPFGGAGAGSAPTATSNRLHECAGSRTSEGDSQLRADEGRHLFDVDGSGIEVGILSDSFSNHTGVPAATAAADIASGDLPGPGNPCGRTTPTALVDDGFPGRDEGRAMAQIVHDLAPGARLSFATASGGTAWFADNIRDLRAAGSHVIVDDYVYASEPFYQDGPISVAVNDVVAGGATYVTLAHNNNVRSNGVDVASWEALAYRPTACPAAVLDPTCMDFDPAAGTDNSYEINVANGARLTLSFQWAEPWFGVATDLDLWFLDASGAVITSARVGNTTSGEPREFLSWTNTTGAQRTVSVVISKFNSPPPTTANPRLKFVQMGNSSQGAVVTSSQYATSSAGDIIGPAIFGHDGAFSAITTAAVPYNDPSNAYSSSSRGPVTLLFGPVTGTTPAGPLPSPVVIPKPDITATHCTSNTFFGSPSPSAGFRFCGTSAAAPHAAAVAALQLAEVPSATNGQARAALAATARPVGSWPQNVVGAGLIQAPGAIDALTPPPTVSITGGPTGRVTQDRPAFRFTSDGPASFQCSFDGGPVQSCASPYRSRVPLRNGAHTFTVTAIDMAGRPATASRPFIVKTNPPKVRFTTKPPRRTRSRRARFAFRSSKRGTTFRCKLDRKPYRRCRSPKTFVVRPGAHVLKVRARDRAGNRGPAATYRWRVLRG